MRLRCYAVTVMDNWTPMRYFWTFAGALKFYEKNRPSVFLWQWSSGGWTSCCHVCGPHPFIGIRDEGCLYRPCPRTWDIINEAIDAYDSWMLDDDYDANRVLREIIERMRSRREQCASKTRTTSSSL